MSKLHELIFMSDLLDTLTIEKKYEEPSDYIERVRSLDK